MDDVLAEFKKLKESIGKDSDSGTPELELRFQDVTYDVFQTVLGELAKKYKWEVEKTVDYRVAIESEHRRSNIIRQITYKKDKKVSDQYRRKDIISTTRISSNALDYNLTLSRESKAEAIAEISKPLVRVKLRFRFRIPDSFARDSQGEREPLERVRWEIHATIIKQLSGDPKTLGSVIQPVVNQMFKQSEITPQTLASALKLPEFAGEYRFEIESELIDTTIDIGETDILNIASLVFNILGKDKTDDIQFQNEVYFIAGYVEENPDQLEKFRKQYGIKNLAPPVIPVNKSLYKKIYPPLNYFASDKADGIHAYVSIHDQKCRVIADKYFEFSSDSSSVGKKSVTILEGELIYEAGNPGSKQFQILVFDAIIVDGLFIGDKGFEIRQQYFEDGSKLIRQFGVKISPKKFVQITLADPEHIKKQIESVLNTSENTPNKIVPQGTTESKSTYGIDGCILVEPELSYKETKIYKVKSLQDNTIDFLAMKAPDNVIGKPPFVNKKDHVLYFLFNGITYDLYAKLGIQFCPGYQEIFKETEFVVPSRAHLTGHEIRALPNLFPIQFSPSDSPLAYVYWHPTTGKDLNGKIIELRCKGKCEAAGGIAQFADWELVRIRGDRMVELANKRYFGNYFRIAEMTWVNYIDPFPMEQVWNGPEGGYFSEEKAGIYFPQTAFTSYVKSKRIENYARYNLVCDLAGGHGQDLRRYIINQIQEVVFIDKDKTALAELDRRKYDIIERIKRGKESPGVETKVRAMWADLNTNYRDIIARIHRNFPETANNKFGAVVSNLAIHYSMNNIEELRNYTSLVQLLTDGTFSITCMLGDRVNKLLTEAKVSVGETWDSYQDTIKKYSIKKLYEGTALTEIGQKIGVMLPFSGGDYYEENLVNVDTLSRELQLRGFKLKAVIPFDEHRESFKRDNPKMYSELTEADFKYLSLYGEIIFTKV